MGFVSGFVKEEDVDWLVLIQFVTHSATSSSSSPVAVELFERFGSCSLRIASENILDSGQKIAIQSQKQCAFSEHLIPKLLHLRCHRVAKMQIVLLKVYKKAVTCKYDTRCDILGRF